MKSGRSTRGKVPLGMVVLVLACSHAPPTDGDASPTSVSLPSVRGPLEQPGWRSPPAAYLGERDRCVDRELDARNLNPFGDPMGTTYPGETGRPLGIVTTNQRYEYVLRQHPEIASTCTRNPLEDER